MTLSYPSHTPSTRFPTGTVLALLAAFRFKDYHPYLSQYFSSCGSHYPETPGTLGWAGPITGYHLAWSILCIYNQAPKLVGMVGFELTTLCSQSRCANQTALHSETWWVMRGSNSRQTACKAATLPLS
jgi:hypothetical protein